jgi:hypothetical protein
MGVQTVRKSASYLKMDTPNNATPSKPLSVTSHVSVLDFFVPGSTSIVTTLEHVLAMNSYAQALFIYMLLVFLGRHICRYAWDLAETHFGWFLTSGFLNRSNS